MLRVLRLLRQIRMKGRPSGNGWQPTRTLVLTRDGYRCQDCGAPANVVDHITPIAHGGSDHPSNLQAFCAACNGAKGDG